ncbi:MAG: peptidoglycan-associated lipoprotein Pal [Desulfobacteraceae bacterium]|nr:MAG: peptidoglycan-associated lipoprotein Pal [Desulfobacteraceae bacterium]
MKRNLIIATLVVFAFSSIFFLSSCAKKQVVTEEKEIKAPPKEVAKVEKEKPVAKEVEEAKEEEVKRAEEARIEKLKELEMAKKREAEAKIDEEKAWQERRAANVEAEAIYFDFDKSFIRLEYRSVLKKKAEFLKDSPDIHIRIEGNCDERGTNEYNLALGERRATSAAKFLISLGISPDRIETISYGEERPLALGHGKGAWAQNRRDDFVVIKK